MRTDGELLRAWAQSCDEEAFTEIVRRHAGVALVAARAVLPRRGDVDADDVAQAVFLALAQQAGRFTPEDSIAGWVHTVARRISAKVLRHHIHIRRHADEQATGAPGSGVATVVPVDVLASLAEYRKTEEALEQVLSDLPSAYLEPILLHYREGLSRQEAATRLNLTEAALDKRLERGREKLRRQLQRRGITVGIGVLVARLAEASAPAGAAELAATEGLGMAAAVLAHGGMKATTLGATPGGSVVTMLTGEIMKMLFWAKVKTATLLIAGVLTLMTLAAGVLHHSLRPEVVAAEPAASAEHRFDGPGSPEKNKAFLEIFQANREAFLRLGYEVKRSEYFGSEAEGLEPIAVSKSIFLADGDTVFSESDVSFWVDGEERTSHDVALNAETFTLRYTKEDRVSVATIRPPEQHIVPIWGPVEAVYPGWLERVWLRSDHPRTYREDDSTLTLTVELPWDDHEHVFVFDKTKNMAPLSYYSKTSPERYTRVAFSDYERHGDVYCPKRIEEVRDNVGMPHAKGDEYVSRWEINAFSPGDPKITWRIPDGTGVQDQINERRLRVVRSDETGAVPFSEVFADPHGALPDTFLFSSPAN